MTGKQGLGGRKTGGLAARDRDAQEKHAKVPAGDGLKGTAATYSAAASASASAATPPSAAQLVVTEARAVGSVTWSIYSAYFESMRMRPEAEAPPPGKAAPGTSVSLAASVPATGAVTATAQPDPPQRRA